ASTWDHWAALKRFSSTRVAASAIAWACQGSAKIGSPSRRRKPSAFGPSLLKITLPEIDEYAIASPGGFGPEVAGLKGDGIEGPGLVTPQRLGIGQDVDSTVGMHQTRTAPHVARQSRMADRALRSHDHLLADAKEGFGAGLAAKAFGAARRRPHLFRTHGRTARAPCATGLSLDNLPKCRDMGIDQERRIYLGPLVEIGPRQVVEGQKQLPDMAPPIEGPARPTCTSLVDAPHAPLPIVFEGPRVVVDLDRTEALDAAEIMHAVHQPPPPVRGALQRAVPIIAFRVTRIARPASSRLSVPVGRCGITR